MLYLTILNHTEPTTRNFLLFKPYFKTKINQKKDK